jgi:hypothetical protein
MAYYQTYITQTREEALASAEAFMETLDVVQQGSIYGFHKTDRGEWMITVQYYGYD